MSRYITTLLPAICLLICISCRSAKPDETGTSAVSDSKQVDEAGQASPKLVFDMAKILEAALNGNVEPVKDALDKGFDANMLDAEMHSALMFASYNGHSEIVQLLLQNGAEPDLRDQSDRTALMYASTGPFNETVLLLLDAGASPNLFDNNEHFTALMFAAAEGHEDVVQSLLKYGADKTMLDIDGESAYDFAMNNGHAEVALLVR